MKVSLLVYDLSSHCLARTYLVGKVLERSCEVEIIGPIFGDGIWLPHAQDFSYKTVKGKMLPFFLTSTKKLLEKISGDVIYAFKPRPTSYGLAILKKISTKSPLIVDIDDWEAAGYFGHYLRTLFGCAALWNPNSLSYTLVTESLIRIADESTVASRFLQGFFGGHYLPHGVDTVYYDPSKYDKLKLREKYGITDEKVVAFIGTPRPHKGLEDLLKALDRVETNIKVKLMLTGDLRDEYTRHIISLGKDKIIFLGIRPRSEEPSLLKSADLVVLPQKATKFSIAQTPAKVFPAMALAKPIIATKISDLPEILNGCGILVETGDICGLSENISYIFKNEDLAKKLGEKAREKCIEKYSWDAMEKILMNILNKYF